MGISLEQYRVSIGLYHKCISSSKELFKVYFNLVFLLQAFYKLCKFFVKFCSLTNFLLILNFSNYQSLFVILIILLQAGDIETNPGPVINHDISLLHLNIRSIRNKIDYIIDTFSDFQILCFTETHLDANVTTDMLSFSNSYSIPYRKDRTNHGGGILVYLNSSLLHTRRPDLEIFCNESIWVEVKAKNEMLLIGVFYSPTTADSQFFNGLNLNIEKAFEISKNLILVGDLNEDLLNPNYHNLKDLILVNSMKNVITEPTSNMRY